MAERLRDLGEAELIRRLAAYAPPGQFEDDTALIESDGSKLLVNTDLLVDGVHFSDATTEAEDVGWRAAAVNLSDLAASGADHVLGITVGLVAPADTPWRWVEGVYQGLQAALHCHGGVLLGGDCTSGHQRMLAITALGRCSPLRLHRNQARPGDWLVVSGPHGLSRLGLALLQNSLDPALEGIDPALCKQAIRQHQRPQPRFDALHSLLGCKPDGLEWRAGGTDSSDGLLTAVSDLCRSSHCGALLDPRALPLAQGWPQTEPWQSWCLNGGEDFELVLSLPPDWARDWLARQPGSQRIGEISDANGQICWSDGSGVVSAAAGYTHFSA